MSEYHIIVVIITTNELKRIIIIEYECDTLYLYYSSGILTQHELQYRFFT